MKKKTVFSYIFPKIEYGISGPQGDLQQWNLSWSFTFNILVHQEGSVENQRFVIRFQLSNSNMSKIDLMINGIKTFNSDLNFSFEKLMVVVYLRLLLICIILFIMF